MLKQEKFMSNLDGFNNMQGFQKSLDSNEVASELINPLNEDVNLFGENQDNSDKGSISDDTFENLKEGKFAKLILIRIT